jgi:2-polyprenyl-3-methyl-5-hydroxy-6-metoxy-1,4-benzoquinol methylase
MSCPICASDSEFLFTSKLNKKIFKCKNYVCGHFFTPQLIHHQGICKRDNNIEKESNEFLRIYDERNLRLWSLFKRNINLQTKHLRILDFGSGNAHIARTFKRILKKNATIYCLEANLNCSELYSKYDLLFIKNIKDLPDEIDFIYMIEVIEHIIDPIRTLKMLKKKLKFGGKFFLSTPEGSEREYETNAFDTDSHLHFFTKSSLNFALRMSGFKTLDYKYYKEIQPLPHKKTIIQSIKGKLFNFFLILKGKARKQANHLMGFTD